MRVELVPLHNQAQMKGYKGRLKDPLFIIPGITGENQFYHLQRFLDPGRPVYVFVFHRDDDAEDSKEESRSKIINEQHFNTPKKLFGALIEAMHMLLPDDLYFKGAKGAVQFACYSSGAIPALALAKRLEDEDRTVSQFTPLDADISRPLATMEMAEFTKNILSWLKTLITRYHDSIPATEIKEALELDKLLTSLEKEELGWYRLGQKPRNEQLTALNAEVSGHYAKRFKYFELSDDEEMLKGELERWYELMQTTFKLIGSYETYNPKEVRLDCPITVFSAGGKSTLGWENHINSDLARGVILKQVGLIGVDHFSLLSMECLRLISQKGPLGRTLEDGDRRAKLLVAEVLFADQDLAFTFQPERRHSLPLPDQMEIDMSKTPESPAVTIVPGTSTSTPQRQVVSLSLGNSPTREGDVISSIGARLRAQAASCAVQEFRMKRGGGGQEPVLEAVELGALDFHF